MASSHRRGPVERDVDLSDRKFVRVTLGAVASGRLIIGQSLPNRPLDLYFRDRNNRGSGGAIDGALRQFIAECRRMFHYHSNGSLQFARSQTGTVWLCQVPLLHGARYHVEPVLGGGCELQ
jgi:hypothetical protein